MDQRKKRLKDILAGTGDWERTTTSLPKLRDSQIKQEKSVSASLKIRDSSYGQRSKLGRTTPDYAGPMTGPGAAAGTRDKMPGTTPTQDPNPPKWLKRTSPVSQGSRKRNRRNDYI